MDSPAFEEGLLEHYPFFLDIVLNHISSDSVEFSHAVTCLKLVFEMLGTCSLFLMPFPFLSSYFIMHFCWANISF